MCASIQACFSAKHLVLHTLALPLFSFQPLCLRTDCPRMAVDGDVLALAATVVAAWSAQPPWSSGRRRSGCSVIGSVIVQPPLRSSILSPFQVTSAIMSADLILSFIPLVGELSSHWPVNQLGGRRIVRSENCLSGNCLVGTKSGRKNVQIA
jgi:hypothetical protein